MGTTPFHSGGSLLALARSISRQWMALTLCFVVVLAVIGVRVVPRRGHMQLNVTKLRIKQLGAAIDTFVLRHGVAPESLDLLFLAGELVGGATRSSTRDKWDEPFVYEILKSPDHGGLSYALRSKGPDRIDHTSDDITLESVREAFPD